MAVSTVVRNFRDGELVVNDGTPTTPLSLTLVLDLGNLTWTETEESAEILDRGRISGGQVRDGNDVPVELSFGIHVNQLIGFTEDPLDAKFLYEMVNNIGGGFVSTLPAGQKFALEYVFTIDGPNAGIGTEIITFGYVYKATLEFAEGDSNQLTFNGKDWETRPDIAHAA